jgi:hypothetical protein
MIKSRRMRLVVLVARVGEKRKTYKLVGDISEKRLYGKIILEWILEKKDGKVWN